MYQFKFLVLISTIFLGSLVNAQIHNQNLNWIFGNFCKVSFQNNGQTNSKIIPFKSIEACASVSDPITGDLIFYSDGIKVYDSTGQIIPNGDSLKSSATSSQGVLILPNPGNKDEYLIFTTPGAFSDDKGLYYSIFSRNINNGKGGIVKGFKNILLYNNVGEGLTYTYNIDSTSYWLIAHERESENFICLEISKNNIPKKIVKNPIGRKWGEFEKDFGGFMGVLKISPNSKYLAVTNSYELINNKGIIELFSFDNCSGKITNELIINGLPPNCYSSSFSQNSEILYTANLNFPSSIIQLDLSSKNPDSISKSAKIIYTAPNSPNSLNYLSGIQLQDNGKIYITEVGKPYLHCINNPNSLGQSCDFKEKDVNLVVFGSASAYYSLPQLVPKTVNEKRLISDSIKITLNDSCLENSLSASINLQNLEAIRWRLISTKNSDTLIISFDSSLRISDIEEGKYIIYVEGEKNCKLYNSFIEVNLIRCKCEGFIEINSICIEDSIQFKFISKSPFTSINWEIRYLSSQNSVFYDNLNSIKFNDPDSILVSVIVDFNSCNKDTFSRKINLIECPNCLDVYIPNSFSPNNDGLNDQFIISPNCKYLTFELTILNRWGQIVFQSTDEKFGWNGLFQEKQCPIDPYFYYLSISDNSGNEIRKKGITYLLR